MMDSVPQETPVSEVEPPEALIAARVEDAEPADEQLKTPVEHAGRIGSFGQRASRVLRLSAGQV